MADKLAQIRALIAKAESTSFPEEADALMGKAEQLITSHSIDRALIHQAHRGNDTVGSTIVVVTGEYRRAEITLIKVVAKHFGCQTYLLGSFSDKTFKYVVVGFEGDREDALFLAVILQAQAVRLGLRFVKEWRRDNQGATGMQRFVAKRSFLFGFADTVDERLTARRAVAAVEHEAGAASVALALRDKGADVDAFMADLGLRELKNRSKWDVDGLNGGRKAGHEADLDPGMGRSRARGIGR